MDKHRRGPRNKENVEAPLVLCTCTARKGAALSQHGTKGSRQTRGDLKSTVIKHRQQPIPKLRRSRPKSPKTNTEPANLSTISRSSIEQYSSEPRRKRREGLQGQHEEAPPALDPACASLPTLVVEDEQQRRVPSPALPLSPSRRGGASPPPLPAGPPLGQGGTEKVQRERGRAEAAGMTS